MEKYKRLNLTLFCKISAVMVFVITIINLVYPFLFKPIAILSENQLMYLFSTSAQVVGAIFGLVLTGYVFFLQTFEQVDDSESFEKEAIEQLKKQYYQNLVSIGILSVGSILLCICGISALKNCSAKFFSFIIDETVGITVITLLSIIYFVVIIINPDRKRREISVIVKQIRIENATQPYERTVTPDKFIINYNRIEEACLEWSQKIANDNQYFNSYYGVVHPRLTYCIQILIRSEMITQTLAHEIEYYRRYRNVLAHSTEENKVSQKKYNRIKKVADALESEKSYFIEHYANESIEKLSNHSRVTLEEKLKNKNDFYTLYRKKDQ